MISITTGAILLIFILTYFGLRDDNIYRSSEQKNSKVQYVLVNEDTGTTFEEKKYALGLDFVTLINQDTKNNWQTASRSVANAGIESGQFDAEIIIPQDFSQRLLSLQSMDPSQAIVSYRVREGQNEVSNQVIQSQVNTILKDFNQRIIQMYFSSIVGNLSYAQNNVNKIVDTELAHQASLEEKIQNPFKALPDNFSGVVEVSSILDEGNKMFHSEQQSFVDSVKGLLDSNNEALASNSTSVEVVKSSVDDYTKEVNEKLDVSVKQFQDQFNLQKNQLELQWGNDSKGYKKQYDILDQSVTNQFSAFYTPQAEQTAASGVFTDFLANAESFQQSQSTRIEEIQARIKDLEAEVSSLNDLKQDIAENYYADRNKTSSTATDDDIKQAIVNLMAKSEDNQVRLDSEYLKQLETDLSQIPADDLEKFLNKLISKNVLTADQAKIFQEELMIVRRYATDNSVTLGTNARFTYIDDKTEHADVISIPNKITTLSLDLTKSTNTISLKALDAQWGTVEVNDSSTIVANLKTTLDNQLKPYNYHSEWTELSTNEFSVVLVDDTVTTPTPATATDSVQSIATKAAATPTLPATMSLTFISNLDWHLPDAKRKESYVALDYAWSVNGNDQVTAANSEYLDLNNSLITDLPELLKQFQRLDTTAQQIVTLFGNPDSSIGIESYAKMIQTGDNSTKLLADLADSKSIYRMYNNITDQQKRDAITDSILNDYKKNGNELYDKAQAQIDQLNKIIGAESDAGDAGKADTLYGSLNLMDDPNKFLNEAEKLNAWYSEANTQIETTYKTWQETDKVQAESVITEDNPHPEKNDTTGISSETSSLVTEIKSLMSSSKESAKATGESAAKVQDISPRVKELQGTTNEIKTSASNILDNLDENLVESQKNTKLNKQYSKEFNTVLANTRNGGADNTVVFDFLSNPLGTEGTFGKTRQTSIVPYYMTLIGSIISITAGFSLCTIVKRRGVKKENLVITPTRMWLNVFNVAIVVAISLVISLVFAAITTTVVSEVSYAEWFMYAFLALFSSIVLIAGLSRQLKNGMLYVLGAVLALYLMLTPLLGMSTRDGSLINIMYHFSPLQNLEDGYTVLVNAGHISWINYAVLLVILLVGILVNFVVLPGTEEAETAEEA